MKIKFWCDANSGTGKGQRTETFDTQKDFGLTDKEWLDLSEYDKYGYVSRWVDQVVSYGWEE